MSENSVISEACAISSPRLSQTTVRWNLKRMWQHLISLFIKKILPGKCTGISFDKFIVNAFETIAAYCMFPQKRLSMYNVRQTQNTHHQGIIPKNVSLFLSPHPAPFIQITRAKPAIGRGCFSSDRIYFIPCSSFSSLFVIFVFINITHKLV